MEQTSIFDLLPEEDAKEHKPLPSTDWKWSFKDYPPKNGLNVFSCFACGGGSTMGYKLAGCEVLGCVEIDKAMYDLYVTNHHPRFPYNMDIREFNKIPNDQLPPELFDLDILDGSPPCTTFSMAGEREESWGKKKKFREGQKEQTLDDLSFVFIETAKNLKPKVVIMENVEGLLLGEAFEYVRRIYSDFKDAGYKVWHWLMKGENMGVPQTRHRTFFVAIREDLGRNPMDLNMDFNYEPVFFKTIKEGIGTKIPEDTTTRKYLKIATETDKCIAGIHVRLGEKSRGFTDRICWGSDILPTIKANTKMYRGEEQTRVSNEDIINASTFPQDYIFHRKSMRATGYVCGMSVPPVMMKRVVTRLIEQGVFDYKIRRKTHED